MEPKVVAKNNGLHLEVDCPHCGKTHLHGTDSIGLKTGPCKGSYMIVAVFQRKEKK